MGLNFKKIIAHKLNVNNNLPILSDSCINISDSNVQDALPFFEKHIVNSRKQSYTRSCQFQNIGDNIVRKSMTSIQNSIGTDNFEDVFVRESKKLTKNLARRIRESTSRSDGSLFVIYYENEGKNMIGLLKMDPNDGVQINDDLTITVHRQMLPSVNEKLHKSALIELKDYQENEHHLFVLDKQQNMNEPAKYFMEKFLNVIELCSDENMTKYIQSSIVGAFNQIIDPENTIVLESQLRKRFLENRIFNVDIDLEPIIKPLLRDSFKDLDLTESLNAFKDEILDKYPDATFQFMPKADAVKEIIFRNPAKTIEIKFSPQLDFDEDYSISREENGDVIVTLKNGVGIGLKEVKNRRS